MDEQEREYEIDLVKVFKYLWKKKTVIILGALSGIVLSLAIWLIMFLTANYASTAVISYSEGFEDKTTAQQQTNSYVTAVYPDMIDEYTLPYSYQQLSQMITVTPEDNLRNFDITVSADDPQVVRRISYCLTDYLPKYYSAFKVVQEGQSDPSRVMPSYKKYILIGFFLGLFIVFVALLVKYFVEKKVEDEDFIINLPEPAPVLAVVPDLVGKKTRGTSLAQKKKADNGSDISGLDALMQPNLSFDAAEAYKFLRTNVLYALKDQEDCIVIGVTSSIFGETTTTTAVNLAYAFAETGKKTLLIEGNMRSPVFAERLSLKATPGFSNILDGSNGIRDTLQSVQSGLNWYAITAGSIPSNPAELLGKSRAGEVFDALRNTFDYIIVDLPPVNVVSDTLIAASYLDGILLVVREAYSSMPDLTKAVQKLNFAKTNLLGFALTDSSSIQTRSSIVKKTAKN